MARGLSDDQKAYALREIRPSPILCDVSNDFPFFDEFVHYCSIDYGRGMLTHEKYCLVENLHSFGPSGDNEQILSERVNLGKLDSVALTISLKAFANSVLVPHSGDILFAIPPMSYGFPLTLTYHLVLQHLGSSLAGMSETKFPESEGILIVSDNIEILSHIWRTSVGAVELSSYIPTYTVQGSKLKEFRGTNGRTTARMRTDGSLPWLAIYRAVRHEMPGQLNVRPKVIIIDLLPFRHRKRAASLVEWARQNSDHIITVAPQFDDSYAQLTHQFKNIVPIDNTSFDYFMSLFPNRDEDSARSPITESWSLKVSSTYLKGGSNSFVAAKMSKDQILERHIADIYRLIESARLSAGNGVINRIQWVLTMIISMPVPLEWYERTLLAGGQRTIRDIIQSCANNPPQSFAERSVYEHIIPTLISLVNEVYEAAYHLKNSRRGLALETVLNWYLTDSKKLTVIVPESISATELKVWLRHRGFSKVSLDNIRVLSQKKWAHDQLKEINVLSNIPNVVICVGPLAKKFLSSFYVHPSTHVCFVAEQFELPLIRYQLQKLFGYNSSSIQLLWSSLKSSFGELPLPVDLDQRTQNLHVHMRDVNTMPLPFGLQQNDRVETRDLNLDSLLGLEALQQLLNIDTDLSDSSTEMHISELVQDLHRADSSVELIESVRLSTRGYEGNDYVSVFFVPNGSELKVLRIGDDQVSATSPLQLKSGDIWVRLKQQLREELFDAILNMSSNTLAMKWIGMNMEQWREMLSVLWEKYRARKWTKKQTYQTILGEINRHGGALDSTLTIANWINGEVSSVRDGRNVEAIARILGDEKYLERCKTIHNAMRQLWNIHIKLGKVLARVVTQQAATVVEGHGSGEWIDLGYDIRIPIEDVIAVLDLSVIEEVETEQTFHVHPMYVYREFSPQDEQFLKERGIIVNE